jgi:hypothetical protein
MAQQTALETFWEQIAEILPFSVDSETSIKLYEKYQEAKEMFKQQMIDFANDYIDDDDIRDLTAEEYYNENYGNNQNL